MAWTPEELAARLRAAIKADGRKQWEVADGAGVNRATLASILGARQEPKIFNVARVAKTLGVSLDYLAGLTDEPHDQLTTGPRPQSAPASARELRFGKWFAGLPEDLQDLLVSIAYVRQFPSGRPVQELRRLARKHTSTDTPDGEDTPGTGTPPSRPRKVAGR